MNDMKMNPAQEEAVKHKSGPALVLAGPGSGKTFVITHRIQYLIEEHQVSPSHILVITFTKAAAEQMQERFMKLSSGRGAAVTFGTFHSVFFRILKYAYNYNASNIAREEQRIAILRELIVQNQIEVESEMEFIQAILAEISVLKNERMSPRNYHGKNCADEVFQKLYQGYEEQMRNLNLVDFDDMLLLTWQLLSARPDILKMWQDKYQYILIDEFQDVNRVQYDTVRLLAEPRHNLFIVGDDDQSIYRFRGSKPEIMLGFEKDYPDCKKVFLNVNYRCNANVVRAAENVIVCNKVRFPKKVEAFQKRGNKVLVSACKDEEQECQRVVNRICMGCENKKKWSDYAVLVRTNTGARLLIEKFVMHNIPFVSRDRIPNVFEHWITKQIIWYLRISHGDRSREAFLQIINKPNRYIGRELLRDTSIDLEKLKRHVMNKAWMVERIDKLQYDLHMMAGMVPFAAINYLRKSVGYETYLKEYGKNYHIKTEELMEILDFVQSSARDYQTLEEWLEYMRNFTEELKTQTQRKKQNQDAVTISTIHSSKGLEYNQVIILDANEDIMPHEKAVLEEDIEEERRLFYVAMTRAKHELFIYYVKERCDRKMKPSRFIEEMLQRKTEKSVN